MLQHVTAARAEFEREVVQYAATNKWFLRRSSGSRPTAKRCISARYFTSWPQSCRPTRLRVLSSRRRADSIDSIRGVKLTADHRRVTA